MSKYIVNTNQAEIDEAEKELDKIFGRFEIDASKFMQEIQTWRIEHQDVGAGHESTNEKICEKTRQIIKMRLGL